MMYHGKYYSCAYRWEVKADSKQEIITKIKQHAKEKHASIPFDETQVHA
jgi:predicted small metal-binding protein